jgi:CHASE3 domain sensor protein
MKFLSYNLSVRHLVILGISVPTLLLLLVGGLQWKLGDDFRLSRERVSNTRIVLLDLDTLLISMLDAETGQRGYLLTHQNSYLEPYNRSLAFSRDQIQSLRQLISDPEQQKLLNRLEPLMKAKSDELAQTLMLAQRADQAGAMQLVAGNSGKNTMDEIRSTVRVMQDSETTLFQQREDAYQRISRINSELSALLLALGLGCIVAILFFLLLHRLEQMQEMVTICAWSKLIEFEGEWLSMEEYLSRRLHARVTHGISQIEAEKMRKLLKYEKLKKAVQAQ